MIDLNTSPRLTCDRPTSSMGPNAICIRIPTSSSVPTSSGKAPTRLNARATRADGLTEPCLPVCLQRRVELLERVGVEVLDDADDVGALAELGVLLERLGQAVAHP